jgi:hypothetical protein
MNFRTKDKGNGQITPVRKHHSMNCSKKKKKKKKKKRKRKKEKEKVE